MIVGESTFRIVQVQGNCVYCSNALFYELFRHFYDFQKFNFLK